MVTSNIDYTSPNHTVAGLSEALKSINDHRLIMSENSEAILTELQTTVFRVADGLKIDVDIDDEFIVNVVRSLDLCKSSPHHRIACFIYASTFLQNSSKE